MAFARPPSRDSLRDIEACLRLHDGNILDRLIVDAGAFHVTDRGCIGAVDSPVSICPYSTPYMFI